MKTLLSVSLAATIIFTSLPTQAKGDPCESFRAAAESFMGARQSRLPMGDVVKIIKEVYAVKRQDVYLDLLNAAYKHTAYNSKNLQKEVIYEFSDEAYRQCFLLVRAK